MNQASPPAQGFQQSGARTLGELAVVLVVLGMLFIGLRGCTGCIADRAAMALPVSIDEKIGKAGAESMRAKHGMGKEPTEQQVKRVERIFGELKAFLSDEQAAILRNPRVTVLVDETVNAFALPGGEVFVLTGLLDRAKDDDEMLRGVLAHELGHAVHRHGVRNLAKNAAYGVVLASLWGEVDGIVTTLLAGASKLDSLSYSRDMESEADAFGTQLLEAGGHSTEGLARFLESLESAPVPEFISTHPDSAARAEAIRERQ